MWDPRTYEDTDYGLDPDESFESQTLDEEVSLDGPHIMTVLGPINPEELGICLINEHLLCEPVGLAVNESESLLNRGDFASEEIEAFVTRGGRAIVESSTRDLGRNAEGLVRLAMMAPVQLISVTGRHSHVHASRLDNPRDVGHLALEFVGDLRDGMDGTAARAGVIIAAMGSSEVTEVEHVSMRAAAKAHTSTGAPIYIYAESGALSPSIIENLVRDGVEASRIIVGHLDRHLQLDYLVDLAREGMFLAFDQVSKTTSPTDAERATMMVRLMEAGCGDRLLLSHGHDRRSNYIAYGGQPGMTYIVERFMLELMEAGADASMVRNMLIENPARALTIHPPA